MVTRLNFLILAVVLCFAMTTQHVSASMTESIAAVVGEDAISLSDVQNRIDLVVTSSGLPKTQDIQDRLMPQILNTLIEEQLKLQEAARYELTISQDEIDQGFENIASQNKMKGHEFKNILRKEGVNPLTLENQIKSQIAWSKVVQSQLRPRISISQREVGTVLDRLRGSIGKTEYRVFEIFLPVNTSSEEPNVLKLAERLYKELGQGKAPFQRVASQFSQSAGANRGGDLGWVQEGQLAEPIDLALSQMDKNELGSPVRSLSGYHILFLADKRFITEDNIPSEDQLRQSLMLERLDRLQRRTLLDIKTAAFIERRAAQN